jgi:hypothetical protein
LDKCRTLAKARGGACLSDQYGGVKVNLLWRCSDGHKWEATPANVQSGSWCPQCSGGLKEEFCRAALESLTGKAWPKARPAWLVNERGGRMELDGYCKDIGVAYEYQGEQHFSEVKHFRSGEFALALRMADDQRKRDLCHAHGIKLIEVHHSVRLDEMLPYLAITLSEKTGVIVRIPEGLTVDSMGYDRGFLDGLRVLARERGGDCLSSSYGGGMTNVRWRCAEGHDWEATPANVQRGSWCPYCQGFKVWSPGQTEAQARLTECQTIAKERGGLCLSETYIEQRGKLRWQCSEGHNWDAKTVEIKKGSWCPFCVGKKVWSPGQTESDARLEECRSIAKTQGGDCLSSEYVNRTLNLQWRCSNGHEWEATPSNIKRGSWCPICARDAQRGSIEECNSIARSRGGMCVSTEYLDALSKVRWRCSQGHEWDAKPNSVKRGSWCPTCWNKNRGRASREGWATRRERQEP